MKPSLILIVVVTLYYNSWFLFGRRISEIKCQEYAQISENASIVNMNRVLLKHATSDPTKLWSIATLISEKFILSAHRSDYNLVGIKAYDMYEGSYMAIDAIFRRPILNTTVYSYDIILLQLRNLIELNSFHRPACLWVTTEMDSSWAELLLSRDEANSQLQTKPVEIMNHYSCRNFNQKPNTFCVRPTRNYKRYVPKIGSPIQVNRSVKSNLTNYYVYGLVLDYSVNTERNSIYATKISNYLDWIEPRVWEFQDICGRRQIDLVPLMNHAELVTFGEFPWHAALIERNTEHPKYICGGTILNENTVLTAAHCVNDLAMANVSRPLFVGLGYPSLNRSIADSESRGVLKIIVHPDYLAEYYENDIALLKLENSINFSRWIQPICLTSTNRLFDSEIGFLPGWGMSNINKLLPDELKKASFPIRTSRFCRDSNRAIFSTFLNENKFCAGYGNGTNACAGDSGGGLVFKVKSQWYIQGLLSQGVLSEDPLKARCDPTQLNIFTNVTQYYDWILENF